MAVIDKIFIQKGITHNMGNYESLRLDVGMGATLAEDDDYQETLTSLRNEVDNALGQLIKEELVAWGRGR